MVALEGELDLSTEHILRSTLRGIMADSPCGLIVDFDGVRFMDSTGLHALIRIDEAASAAGCRLRLTGLRPNVRRPIDIAGLAPLFEISDDAVSVDGEVDVSPIDRLGA